MLNTIPHLTDDHQKRLADTVSQIVAQANVDKIICFGVRTHSNFIWSSFLDGIDECTSMECDLLILTQERGRAKRDEISNTVSKLSNALLKFTTLVHSIDSANEELKKGNYFFSSLCLKGVLLYGDQAIAPNTPIPIGQSLTMLEPYWQNRYDLAQRFLKGASHAITQGWNDQAIFMLHQAVEQICIALVRLYMGYRATTHRLSTLLALVENFSLYSITVFPRITQSEIRLFNVLEKAYSDARYDENYTVSAEIVEGLRMQVEDLLETAHVLSRKKLEVLNTRVDAYDVSPFESIGLDTFARVVLKKGEKERVEVESQYDSGKCVRVKVEEGRLWISTTNLEHGKVLDATVCIVYKKLSGLVVHHAERVTCNELIEAEWLGVVHNGPGHINLPIDVLVLDATLNKAGNIVFSGSADEARILNNRSGDFNGTDLEVTQANVTIKGSGNVSIHVEDELHMELTGSGSLLLKGAPRIKSMKVTGTGALKIIDNNCSNG